MTPCRLCGTVVPLQDSHLVSNSIVKRFYRTSPTAGARTVGAPNRREQSFLHKLLLCKKCEQRFALREDRWMKKVDQRMGEPLPWSFVCTESHRYFAASFAWRNLVWWSLDDPNYGFTHEDRRHLHFAEIALQEYLLERAAYPDGLPVWSHIVAPPDGFTGAPPGLNVYLRGSLDSTLNGMGESIYSIGVYAGYLLVMVIWINPEHLITWTLGTELDPGKLVHFDPRRFPEDPGFRTIVAVRAKAGHESTLALSPKQHQNIKRRIEAVSGSSLATNPHVIATMIDRINSSSSESE
jgi:hypothetical protein